MICFFFFFNDPATTEIYTLSLHDALPIFADDFHEGLQQPVHALVLRPRADRADAVAACLAKRAPGRSQRAQVEINGSIHRFVLRYATDQRSYSAWVNTCRI